MNHAKELVVLAVFLSIFAAALDAQAVPVPPATTIGQSLLATGNTIFVAFLFSRSSDTSQLFETAVNNPALFLFDTQAPVGTIASFGTTIPSLLTFELRDLSVPATFDTGAFSTNAAYLLSSDVAVIEGALGVNLTAPAEAALASLAANGPVVVVAFDDRALAQSDKDFDDLIFAFAPGTASVSTPGPASLALLLLGLLVGSARWVARALTAARASRAGGIGFLGASAVVAGHDGVADPIEQAGLRRLRRTALLPHPRDAAARGQRRMVA